MAVSSADELKWLEKRNPVMKQGMKMKKRASIPHARTPVIEPVGLFKSRPPGHICGKVKLLVSSLGEKDDGYSHFPFHLLIQLLLL